MVTTKEQDRQLDKMNMITTDNDKFNNHEVAIENRQEALHAKKSSISLCCIKKIARQHPKLDQIQLGSNTTIVKEKKLQRKRKNYQRREKSTMTIFEQQYYEQITDTPIYDCSIC